MTTKAGEALLGDLVGLITKHLKKGERIRIAGLGILQVRRRAARMGRNPATGEAIQIEDGGLRPYSTLCVVSESWRGGGSSLSETVESYPACQPDVNLSRCRSTQRDRFQCEA